MIGNFFRRRKDQTRGPVRPSFRPMLESLEERVVLSSSFAGLFGSTTPTAQSSQSSTNSSSNTLGKIMADMVQAGNAAAGIFAAQGSSNSSSSSNSTSSTTNTANLFALYSQYTAAVTDLISQLSTLSQSYSNSGLSPFSYSTGGYTSPYGSYNSTAYASQSPLSGLSNPIANLNGLTSALGNSPTVVPTGSGQFVA